MKRPDVILGIKKVFSAIWKGIRSIVGFIHLCLCIILGGNRSVYLYVAICIAGYLGWAAGILSDYTYIGVFTLSTMLYLSRVLTELVDTHAELKRVRVELMLIKDIVEFQQGKRSWSYTEAPEEE